MQMKDVIGQQEIKKHLVQMVQHNRLSHALMFLGKEGVGALPLACAFAQYIVCEHKEANGDACGSCAACKKAQALVHPDIHFSFPTITQKSGEKPKSDDFIVKWRGFMQEQPYGNVYDWLQYIGAENKQGKITAAECNDIFRKLSLKSYESEYKILIQWLPEYMAKEGNKLLKLIEEPPAKTLMIFVSENLEKVLGTIQSRTQLVKIPLLDTKELAHSLETQLQLSTESALQIANIAEGNYRKALQLAQNSSEDWQLYLRSWLNAILKGGNIPLVKWVDEMSKKGRENQKQFLHYFNHLLAQSIRLRIIGIEHLAISPQDEDFASRLNKIASVSQQEKIVEELDKAAYYIERNANGKILFHALSIKLRYIIQQKTLILNN